MNPQQSLAERLDARIRERQAEAQWAAQIDAYTTLLLNWRWVSGRREQIVITGESLIQRSTGIDLDLGLRLGQIPNLGDSVTLPLAYVDKGELRDYRVIDASKHQVSLLPVEEAQELAIGALRSCARLLSSDLPEEWLAKVTELVTQPSHRALKTLKNLEAADDLTLREIAHDASFHRLCEQFARGYYLSALVKFKPTPPQSLTVSYEEVAQDSQPFIDVVRRNYNWFWRIVTSLFQRHFALPLGDAANAHKYRVEISAPDGLLFDSAAVEITPLTSKEGPAIQHVASGLGGRQIVFSRSGVEAGNVAVLTTNFILDPTGLLRSAFYISTATTLLFSISLVLRLADWARPMSDQSAAVLVALPGILTTYLFTTQTHPFVDRATRRVRTSILASALISLLGAALLVVIVPYHAWTALGIVITTKRAIWALLTIASFAVGVILGLALRSATNAAKSIGEVRVELPS